jgi:Na+-transporting methylmalonyl-CoA/oxaloacetate decarboxylase gamma subunit
VAVVAALSVPSTGFANDVPGTQHLASSASGGRLHWELIALAFGVLCVLFVAVIGAAAVRRRRMGANELPAPRVVDEVEAELQEIIAAADARTRTRTGVGL